MKRFLSLTLALVMALTLLTACGVASTGGTDVKAGQGTLFSKTVTLSEMVYTNSTYPLTADMLAVTALEKAANVKLDLTLIPGANWNDKLNVTIASGKLPDIVSLNASVAGKYGPAGAFVNVDKYLDKTPNFARYYNDKKLTMMMNNFKASDGKLYGFPSMNYEGSNRHVWYYRPDIFEANKLTVPKNFDELYTVLKTLKEKYPDSIPLIVNTLVEKNERYSSINMLSRSWGTGVPYYFDQKTETWRFGAKDEGFKALVMWFNKVYKENLIPKDFPTMTQDQYRENVATGKTFVSFYYEDDLSLQNLAWESKGEKTYIRFMPPPAGMVNGEQIIPTIGFDNELFGISAKSKKIDDAVKYIDWLYSDQGRDIASWGEEGVSYKVVNGEKQYVLPAGRESEGVRKVYGFQSRGTFRVFDDKAKLAGKDQWFIEAFTNGGKYEAPLNPFPSLTDEESKIDSDVGVTITDKFYEQVTNFIMGKRDFSEWDKFIEEINALGVDKILKIRNDAYQRVKGK